MSIITHKTIVSPKVFFLFFVFLIKRQQGIMLSLISGYTVLNCSNVQKQNADEFGCFSLSKLQVYENTLWKAWRPTFQIISKLHPGALKTVWKNPNR